MTPAARAELHDRISVHLNRIAKVFKPGTKLTLVVRQPHLPGDTGVLLTNDDPEAAIAEIRKLLVSGEETP